MTTLTDRQRRALMDICRRYRVQYTETDYQPQFDLPEGWVAGWVGGDEQKGKTIYVGCDPRGCISS